MKVIYHANCIDGFTAAWCAWRKYGDAAEYIPANYGDEPPDVRGHDVLIVDFSYPREVLIAMRDNARDVAEGRAERIIPNAKSLLVLDHHKTAEADLSELPFCTFDMTRSGAGLAWDVLHGDKSPFLRWDKLGSQRPALVNYVEDRDLWRWKLTHSREVSAWLSVQEFDFRAWDNCAGWLEDNMGDVYRAGSAVLRSVSRYVDSQAKNLRIGPIGGHEVPVINTTYAISELVGKLAELPDVPFAAGWFQRQDGKFVYSLRSRGDFDVSAVARLYGGGGHKNAAGFTTEKLIHG